MSYVAAKTMTQKIVAQRCAQCEQRFSFSDNARTGRVRYFAVWRK